MLANNETGAIQPVGELAAMAREQGALFHTDAVQAVGKIPVDVEELGVDLLTLSAHKFHGPKGWGHSSSARASPSSPLVSGGHQEQGLRAGTENVLGIVGFGRAAELALKHLPETELVREKRDRLERGILEILPQARVNGPSRLRLPNTLNVTFPGFRGESLVLALDPGGRRFLRVGLPRRESGTLPGIAGPGAFRGRRPLRPAVFPGPGKYPGRD